MDSTRRRRARPRGYAVREDDGMAMHEFLLGPIPEGHYVKHINGDTTDNRMTNLVITKGTPPRGYPPHVWKE